MRLEKALTKDQIMNYYLNRIYFGKGYFGVGAAARGYFGKDAIEPDRAGMRAAGRHHSRADQLLAARPILDKAKWRRDTTLRQMSRRLHQRRRNTLAHINTPDPHPAGQAVRPADLRHGRGGEGDGADSLHRRHGGNAAGPDRPHQHRPAPAARASRTR